MFKKIFFFLLLFISLISGTDKPYVLLISFDGFRWDYLNRGLTPNIDKLISNGSRALSLQPCFPSKTFPNHYSIITGMYPENHGIISNLFFDIKGKKLYRLGDSAQVRNSEWYLGEAFWETAERNGIKTASYFWPGSEVHLDYRHPTYFKEYNKQTPYKNRVDGIIDWLKLPTKDRPHFLTLYFEATDDAGHDFGTNSAEVNKAIKVLDSTTAYLIKSLTEINFLDSINIILLSDHGMTNTPKEKIINIETMIHNQKVRYIETGPVMKIDCSPQQLDDIYNQLKSQEDHFRVYKKENMPEYLHYSKHPFISPIIIIADLGYSLIDNRTEKKGLDNYSAGNHGFDNTQLDMHGIFIAHGKVFKKNFTTGTLQNIDVYPLLCKIFNISPRSNIDGKLENIEFILERN